MLFGDARVEIEKRFDELLQRNERMLALQIPHIEKTYGSEAATDAAKLVEQSANDLKDFKAKVVNTLQSLEKNVLELAAQAAAAAK